MRMSEVTHSICRHNSGSFVWQCVVLSLAPVSLRGFSVLCWLSRCLLGTACNDVWTVLSVQCWVWAALVRTALTTIQVGMYWVFSAQCTGCWGFFVAVDTGQGHWVEGIMPSTGILMSIFCQRSVSSTFTPHTPSSPSFTIHFSTSSSFTPLVTQNQPTLPSPSVKHPAYSNMINLNSTLTHMLTLRTALPIEVGRSFTHSLNQLYFSMVAFVPFISWQTKDFCVHGTEERRGMESRSERKRADPWVWSSK